MVPFTDLPYYTYDDIRRLGIEVCDETGCWLVPYAVLFPIGDLDQVADTARSVHPGGVKTSTS